ncbi:uncharacterized protein F4822DRAFT_198577 [Hypoxylon trugodes]|uniref:uncharacterized protein n=1 Tax=Hypoxylon trugodes TaxID=326681 RepID=UPI00218D3658|nr:uncharacterized protein F4822DRAFT_198577 [Hypoxylon trugodes]KAI1389371.1 hypothetical protein F4822DRAFT_198577 [Hypoxylon trugodes]
MAAGILDTHSQRLTVGIVITCLAFSILSFGLRIYARSASAAKLWWDDYWMCLPMLICIAMSTNDFVGLVYGSGQHQADLDEETVIKFMKNLYIYEIFWSIGVFSVKVGILLFYWRVFHTKSFRISAIGVGCFSLMIFISNFFSFALQCTPVASFWEGKIEDCIDQNTFYSASAIINVIGDVAVLVLPLPVVWKLNTSRSKKWSLSFLFLLGAFVCVASIFRIIGVYEIDPTDFTFSNVSGGLWSTVEVEIGFICANLPAVRPIVFKWFGVGSSAATYASGSAGPRQYGVSSKGAARSGHIILRSRNNESGQLDSDTEALTRQGKEEAMNLPDSREPNGEVQEGQAFGLTDIVVKTDIGVSIDANQPLPDDMEPNHYVRITAPRSRTANLTSGGGGY